MKKLKPNTKCLKTGELFFEDCYGTKVICIGDNQFAIKRDFKRKPICAFESEAFGAVLEKYHKYITHLQVLIHKCEMCPCKAELLEVHFHLIVGQVIIEHDDTILMAKAIDA